MIIEYFVDGYKHRRLLKEFDFSTSNGFTVKYSTDKARGNRNYLVTISTDKDTLESARALSEIHCRLKQLFLDNQIYYRILTNEPVLLYCKRIYPKIAIFESRLRKFVHSTLFDLDEQAKKNIATGLRANIEKLKGCKDITKVDYLEKADLGGIQFFLFNTIDVSEQLKVYLDNTNKEKLTAENIIQFIQEIPKRTVWQEFFEKDFSDSILPTVLKQIREIRNDIMHFHDIDYFRYEYSIKLLNKAIKDLDKQISKGIVIENNNDNLSILMKNVFCNTGISQFLTEIAQSFLLVRKNLLSTLVENTRIMVKSALPDYALISTYLEPIRKLNYAAMLPKIPTLREINPAIFDAVSNPIIVDEQEEKQTEEVVEEGDKNNDE